MRIDTHQHFWKYNEKQYGWMGLGMDSLKRDYLPVELAKFLDNCEVLSRYAYGWDMRPIVLDPQQVFGETYEKLRRIGAARWT